MSRTWLYGDEMRKILEECRDFIFNCVGSTYHDSTKDDEEFLDRLDAALALPSDDAALLREALEKIDEWCCPTLCKNCADNRETARKALNAGRG